MCGFKRFFSALFGLSLCAFGCSNYGNNNPLDTENPDYQNITPVKIQEVRVQATRITLDWEADREISAAIVVRKASATFEATYSQEGYARKSRAEIQSLSPLTDYRYRLQGNDRNGLLISSEWRQVKTTDYVSLLLAGQVTTSTTTASGTASASTAVSSSSTFTELADMKKDLLGKEVLLVDAGANQIKALDLVTLSVRTLAGSGKAGYADDSTASATFRDPRRVSYHPDGSLYVLDGGNHAIRKISGGQVTTVAGNGSPGFSDDNPGSSCLSYPLDFFIDSKGEIYIADTGNQRVRKLSNGRFTTLVGNGQLGFQLDSTHPNQKLGFPSALARVDESLYFFEGFNGVLKKLGVDGTVSYLAGKRTPDTGDSIKLPYSTGAGSSVGYGYISRISGELPGRVILADRTNGMIRELLSPASDTLVLGDPATKTVATISTVSPYQLKITSDKPGTYGGIVGFIFKSDGNLLLAMEKRVILIIFAE